MTNIFGTTKHLFIGVDSLATDGYDGGIVFTFGDTTLTEDLDLPPFEFGLVCRLIRDSNDPANTYTYVDMRGIHDEPFFHKYTMLIK